jgi:hypothetical protein
VPFDLHPSYKLLKIFSIEISPHIDTPIDIESKFRMEKTRGWVRVRVNQLTNESIYICGIKTDLLLSTHASSAIDLLPNFNQLKRFPSNI